jgi:hypothetical protein
VAALRELAGGRADLLAEARGSWRARPRASCTSRWPARRVHQNRAPVRIEIPSARAEASAHVRSRSAWSSRHAARETRASTRAPPIEAIGSSRLAAERSVSATDPVPAGELWHVRGLAWPWSARHPAFIEQLLTART